MTNPIAKPCSLPPEPCSQAITPAWLWALGLILNTAQFRRECDAAGVEINK